MRKALCGFNDTATTIGREMLVLVGPTLFVDIGFDPEHKVTTKNPPDLPMKGVHALVDTGATESCIDSLLAARLKLPVVDQRLIGGIGGAKRVNVHLAQIYIPSLVYTINGLFAAVDLQAGGQRHSALIGRSFLQEFRLAYDGSTGTVELVHVPRSSEANVAPE